ncbi:Gibberellin 3-beta-dioxygenase 4 [Forsythia ovata]|uniref:Gibberellin 3-beta-dioxygenase 4 n=1 Tax=Forsythia ovata TaxID=205694 RepID=A0ABD1RH71_9LAMI
MEVSSLLGLFHCTGSEGALQLHSYPYCMDLNRATGLTPHVDSLLVTVLHQSTTNELQIHRNGFVWLLVPLVFGVLVVNIGGSLHILSNGRFPTIYHCAVPNQIRRRISVA